MTDYLHINDCVWGSGGWEDACWGSVQDASDRTRGQAAARFATEAGVTVPEVRVWKRWVAVYSRQDAWEFSGRERAVDDYSFDHDVDYEKADAAVPQAVPDDWFPGEGDPAWEFVAKDDPRGRPAWICGFKGDRPPRDPAKKVVVS